MGFHQKSVGAAALCVALVLSIAGAAGAVDLTIRAVDQPAGETQLLVQHFVPPTDKAGGGSLDCEALANNPGIEPPTFAAECGYWKTSVIGGVNLQRGPTDTGFAKDIGFVSPNFVSFQLNDFPGQTIIGTPAVTYWSMDFDPSATTLYALEDATQSLVTVDLATGNFTPVNACANPEGPLEIWTGLAIDPSTGDFYASSALNLYTIDPANPTDCSPVLIGAFGSAGGVMIDIAMNTAGELYGHDLGDDTIYSIDTATGAATAIGLTGYDASYAQGMDFDNIDGTLYIALYIGGGANVYGTVDLATGAVTALATDNPQGEFEMATQTAGSEAVFCNGPLVEFEDGIPPTFVTTDNGGPFAWVTTADPSVAANETGGTGESAIADADAFNQPGDPYDAELWTNSFSLATASAANLDLRWRHRAFNNSTFNIDVSDDGGGSWTGLVSDAAGNPSGSAGDAASLDLTPWAGADDVTVRFRFQGNAWDYYAQVDEIALDCIQPAITMVKTVGTEVGICATTDTIVVPPGTDVYYCYTVTNTGNTALGLHDLVDDQLGTILDDLAYDLQPDASVEVILTAVNITTTTVNTATWTAFNPDPVEADEAEATDDATVVVLENDTCDDAIELTCPEGGGTFSVMGSTLLASYTGPFDCDTTHTAPELWYKIMGNGGGITASTCSANTNYDTKLSSFDGTCGALGCVVGDDDDSSCSFSGLQTTINWTSVLGTENYIMVHGYSSGVGDFELTITCDIPVELQSFTIE